MENKKNQFIVAAVAGIFSATLALAGSKAPAKGAAAAPVKEEVKCSGVNSCKGKGACSAADGSHECGGHNACKGKGWVKMNKKDCLAKKGTVVED